MEVGQANGYDFQLEGLVLRQRTEGHHGDAGLEREEVGAVMASAFGEDAQGPTRGQPAEYRRVHC